MTDFLTIGETIKVDQGYGRFIEIARKSNGKNEFIPLSLGEYWSDGNGNNGCRYKKNFSFAPAALSDVIKALSSLGSQTP